MLLEERGYSREALRGKIVLLTGGGGGIGAEAARAFAYMGAKVIIAEVDEARGARARDTANAVFGDDRVDFVKTDLADEGQIDALCDYALGTYGRVDAVVHNAAVVPMGAVEAVPVAAWDRSYAVNLRAPVLLTQKLLPHMKKTGGVIVFNPSNPGAYMSAYEIFKSAQVEMMSALEVELEGSGIITYAVAPGFVKTDTCMQAVKTVSAAMGMDAEEFYASVAGIMADAEIAGAGYAVSVANAERYRGQVAFSSQVLQEAGLLGDAPREAATATPAARGASADGGSLPALLAEITAVFEEQIANWKKKNLFFRQFVLNDFKKQTGIPAEAFLRQLQDLREAARNGRRQKLAAGKDIFVKLQKQYAHQRDMLASFEKDPAQLQRDTALMNGWIDTLQEALACLDGSA